MAPKVIGVPTFVLIHINRHACFWFLLYCTWCVRKILNIKCQLRLMDSIRAKKWYELPGTQYSVPCTWCCFYALSSTGTLISQRTQHSHQRHAYVRLCLQALHIGPTLSIRCQNSVYKHASDNTPPSDEFRSRFSPKHPLTFFFFFFFFPPGDW